MVGLTQNRKEDFGQGYVISSIDCPSDYFHVVCPLAYVNRPLESRESKDCSFDIGQARSCEWERECSMGEGAVIFSLIFLFHVVFFCGLIELRSGAVGIDWMGERSPFSVSLFCPPCLFLVLIFVLELRSVRHDELVFVFQFSDFETAAGCVPNLGREVYRFCGLSCAQ